MDYRERITIEADKRGGSPASMPTSISEVCFSEALPRWFGYPSVTARLQRPPRFFGSGTLSNVA